MVCGARDNILSIVFVAGCLLIIQSYVGTFELDRQQVLSGEIWRIWTSHFVHVNNAHLSLNIVAAMLIYFAFYPKIKLRELLVYSFIFSGLISVALLYFYPYISWYNGLSGLLHALVVYFSICLAKDGNKILWVGLVCVWVKILIEEIRAQSGYVGIVGDMIIVTEAHLLGALVGSVAAFIHIVPWKKMGQSGRRDLADY